MNNEIKLYELIKSKIDPNTNCVAMHDTDVAQQLNVSKFSIPNYKRKLVKNGFIETKVRVVDNKPITLYRIIKEYTGQPQW